MPNLPKEIMDRIIHAVPFDDLWLRLRMVSFRWNVIAMEIARALFYKGTDVGIDAYGYEAPPLFMLAEPFRPVDNNADPRMLQWVSRKFFQEIPGEYPFCLSFMLVVVSKWKISRLTTMTRKRDLKFKLTSLPHR